MNDTPTDSQGQLSKEAAQKLIQNLFYKEGTWVDWGNACRQLQQGGYSAQQIFEETGFQASQQNLIIVAAQVYESIAKAGVEESVLSYFRGPKSDVLYEFRILNQDRRVQAAQLAWEKQLDVDSAREVAKAIKEVSLISQLPSGFTNDPGDAVAYLYWKRARQKKDLQERSRLIARGLKFANSPSARGAIEKLLSDFTIVPSRTAPLLPLYRLETEAELPRIVPVAGTFPLRKQQLEAVSPLEVQEPFRVVEYSSSGALVPIPGWGAVLAAVDPVAIFLSSDRLPKPLTNKPETVLALVDRGATLWDTNSYFLVEVGEFLEFQWFEESPDIPILGQLVLILRPKKIVDENNITEPWQMDD